MSITVVGCFGGVSNNGTVIKINKETIINRKLSPSDKGVEKTGFRVNKELAKGRSGRIYTSLSCARPQ